MAHVIETMREVPSLYISSDDYEGDELAWPITNTLLIGRELADITIALPSLSRRHAEVSSNESIYRIRDLNSKNGTAVNGDMLSTLPHQLKHGDTILLAGMIELTFNDPNATPIAPRLGKLKGLWLDPNTQSVWVDAQKLIPPLSRKQAMLLQIIADAEGQIISKDDIISSIWPGRPADSVSNDAIDSLIKRLRRRLATVEGGNTVLEMVRGRGIRLRQGR